MTIYSNIVLTGFMATGKTTVGKYLAALLQLPFCDTDSEIIRCTGMTIEEIFTSGERQFRKIEAQVFTELLKSHRGIIATGGGTLINRNSRQLALQSAMVICLYAPLHLLEKRLAEEQRPLKDQWRQLWKTRGTVYDSFFYQVDIQDKTPQQIANQIAIQWNLKQTLSFKPG